MFDFLSIFLGPIFVFFIAGLMFILGGKSGENKYKYHYIFRVKEDGSLWEFIKPGGPIELTIKEMDMISNAIGSTPDYPSSIIPGHFVKRLE